MEQATGHGEKLGRKQETAIAALLSEPTLQAAAERVGIKRNTLWRWLQLPAFDQAYREARRRSVEQAIATLQAAGSEAVATLRQLLTCGHEPTRARAAEAILAYSIKGIELSDLIQRVRELELLVEGTKS